MPNHDTNPEHSDVSAEALFDDIYDELDGMPEQEDDQLTVKNTGIFMQGVEGRQKVIGARTPRHEYQVGIAVQTVRNPNNGQDEREISVNVSSRGNRGYRSMVEITYCKDLDPLGGVTVRAQVLTPDLNVRTVEDMAFIDAMGMTAAFDAADLHHQAVDVVFGEYEATPEEITHIGSLPTLATGYHS